MEVQIINNCLSYLKASKGSPLSADVIRISGASSTWFYDVGANESAFEFVSSAQGKKNIVLSHFHPDHIGNLERILKTEPDNEVKTNVYQSAHTIKYTGGGIICDKELCITDGAQFRIKEVPSCHAKGCIGLIYNEEYIFLGDAIYSTQKKGKTVYNVQQLNGLIQFLEQEKAEICFVSHKSKPMIQRDHLIRFLKMIYSRRAKNEAYIEMTFFDELNKL